MTAEDKDVVTIQLFVRNKKTKKLNPCLLKEITVLHTIAKRKDGVNEFDKLINELKSWPLLNVTLNLFSFGQQNIKFSLKKKI